MVAGTPVCQRRSWCVPCRTQRESVGTEPEVIAWRSSGSLTPSSWTTSSPGPTTPARGVARTARPRTWPRKTWSLEVSTSQLTNAAATAAAQLASTISPRENGSTVCTTASAMPSTTAWASSPKTSSPTTPVMTVSRVISGRSRAPMASTRIAR